VSVDAARRARYLEALGIDLWVPRVAPARSPAVANVAPSAPPDAVAAPARLADPTGPGLVEGLHALAEGAAADLPVAADWEGLRAQVRACTRCGLHRGRTQAVFASGDPAARWMVVGEAPGADEDRLGEPFVGRAGQLLNAMLAAIGLPRPTVFVANMLKCRPPQNRDPRPEELAACRPYLERQLELLRPTLLLVVGRIAAQNLLGTEAPLGRLRGRVHAVGGLNLPAIVTYHPAYLLRSPSDKRKAWEDLKLARRVFGELASGKPP
jgi:DNA polymerase